MKLLTKENQIKNISLAFSGWELGWKGLINNKRGEWWLIGQILLILAHLLPATPPTIIFGVIWPRIFIDCGISLICIGIFLAIKSFISLGVNLSPLPQPKPSANLVIKDSYKYCRHPLYKAICICSIGSIITLGSLLHLLLFISLSIILIGKAKQEEYHLQKIHKKYKNYLKSTPAIIKGLPFFDWRA